MLSASHTGIFSKFAQEYSKAGTSVYVSRWENQISVCKRFSQDHTAVAEQNCLPDVLDSDPLFITGSVY